MVSAFLRGERGVGGPRGGLLMSTHPGIGERVSRVSTQIRGMPPGGATLAQRFTASTR